MSTRTLWNFAVVLLTYLPWLVVAAAGAAAFFRNKALPRGPLMVQIVGALGAFVIGVGQWLIMWLLVWGEAPLGIYDASGAVLTFLVFVAEMVFAGGYAWEKFSAARQSPAFPVT